MGGGPRRPHIPPGTHPEDSLGARNMRKQASELKSYLWPSPCWGRSPPVSSTSAAGRWASGPGAQVREHIPTWLGAWLPCCTHKWPRSASLHIALRYHFPELGAVLPPVTEKLRLECPLCWRGGRACLGLEGEGWKELVPSAPTPAEPHCPGPALAPTEPHYSMLKYLWGIFM